MARKPRSGTSLSPEDRRLWEQVARSATPMPGRETAVGPPPPPDPPAPPEPPRPKTVEKSAAPARPPSWSLAKSARGPAPEPLDRRLLRKVSRGHVSVDATIDLHGLTQAQAESRLFAFLRRCHERDLRLVLVITGKGGRRAQTSGWSVMEGPEPGVLKRAVPLWLAEPRYRDMVVGFGPAARQHGGMGALYVRLRRRPGGEARSP